MKLYSVDRAEQSKKLSLEKDNGSMDARIKRKLVALKEKDSQKTQRTISELDWHHFRKQNQGLSDIIKDNAEIQETLPDIKLAKRILVSGILSPNDMISTRLNYYLEGNDTHKEGSLRILSLIEDYFTREANILDNLPELLADVLFNTGSYPVLILPETVIDTVINSDCQIGKEDLTCALESLNSNLGLLGKPSRPTPFVITDNFNLLKKPSLLEKKRAEAVQALIRDQQVGLEAKALYPKRVYDKSPLQVLRKEPSRFGAPVLMKIPSSATLPVYVPGNPSAHVGYFILLDETGRPLSQANQENNLRNLKRTGKNEAEARLSEMVVGMHNALYGDDLNRDKNKINFDLFVHLLEEELGHRLSEGVFEEETMLANISQLASIMFSRALSQKGSSLLFVPVELLTYFAFDYNLDGLGESLLDKSRILSGIRTVLMLSNVIGSIRNSVPRTTVNIELDPDDIDPALTVETLMAEFFKGQGDAFPLWENNPVDITRALQRSSVDVVVSGNARYPQTKMDVTDKARSVILPDNELENQMRRRHYMSMGLPPEIMDAEMNVEFATTLISSNLMLAKEISLYQKILSDQITEHVRKIILMSPELYQRLEKEMHSLTKKEQVSLPELLTRLRVTLPAPDTNRLESQIKAFDIFTAALDKVFESYFSENMFGRIFGNEMEEAVKPTIVALKSHYERRWLRKNNVLPELETLVEVNDQNAIVDFNKLHEDHIDAFIEVAGDLFRKIKQHGEKIMNLIEQEKQEEEGRASELETTEGAPSEGESTEPPTEEETPEMPEEAPTEEEVPEMPEEAPTEEEVPEMPEEAPTEEEVPEMPEEPPTEEEPPELS